MGHFDAYPALCCQNDEVSTVCTPSISVREGVADTPTDHGSKLPAVVRSSSAQRGILNEVTFSRFAPDYD